MGMCDGVKSRRDDPMVRNLKYGCLVKRSCRGERERREGTQIGVTGQGRRMRRFLGSLVVYETGVTRWRIWGVEEPFSTLPTGAACVFSGPFPPGLVSLETGRDMVHGWGLGSRLLGILCSAVGREIGRSTSLKLTLPSSPAPSPSPVPLQCLHFCLHVYFYLACPPPQITKSTNEPAGRHGRLPRLAVRPYVSFPVDRSGADSGGLTQHHCARCPPRPLGVEEEVGTTQRIGSRGRLV